MKQKVGIKILLVAIAVLAVVLPSPLLIAKPNTLTEKEKAVGFKLLFNGKGFDGWKQSGNWIINDSGELAREGKGGSLVYSANKVPDDFELRFEWKVGKGSIVNLGTTVRQTLKEFIEAPIQKGGLNRIVSTARYSNSKIQRIIRIEK